MAETVTTYWAKIGVDSSEFTAGISKAQGSFLSFYSSVTIAAEMTMQIIGRITDQVKKLGENANMILDLSYNTGLTTQKIQELQYAAAAAGVEMGTVSNAINQLTRSMEAGQRATTEQAKAFADLGVQTNGRSVDQVLNDTFKALVGCNDITRRNADAMAIFGRSYKEILPLMEEYDSNLTSIKNKPFISEKDLNTINDAKSAIEEVSTALQVYASRALALAMKDPLAYFGNVGDVYEKIFGQGPLGGADWTNPNELNKKSGALKDVANEYEGLTDKEIELKDAEEALAKAHADYEYAIAMGDPEGKKKAGREIAIYTNAVNAATAALKDFSAAQKGTKWDNSVVVGSVGSEMYDYLMAEQEMGTDYQTAMQKWSQGGLHKPAAQAGTLGAAKESGASTASKAKKIEEENKRVADATKSGYIELEKMTLTHETALAEMSRTKYQALLDYAAEAVNWAGSHPIIQKQAVLSVHGYDIDISALPTVTAPKLASADFSSIKTVGGAQGGAGGATTNNNSVNINMYVSGGDTKKIEKAVSAGVADGFAKGGAV